MSFEWPATGAVPQRFRNALNDLHVRVTTLEESGPGEGGGLTEAQADLLYAPIVHNHDGTYYTQAQITTLLAGKAASDDARLSDARTPTAHTHPISEVTNLQTALDGKSATSHNHDAAYAAVDHTHEGGGGEAFPVGSIFISVVATDPATLLGYGTWAAFGAGRTLVGIDPGQTEFDTVKETGGAKTHTLTEAEMPSHTHVQGVNSATTGGTSGYTPDTSTNTRVNSGYSTSATGGGGAHNNLQPFIVTYFWERTA